MESKSANSYWFQLSSFICEVCCFRDDTIWAADTSLICVLTGTVINIRLHCVNHSYNMGKKTTFCFQLDTILVMCLVWNDLGKDGNNV